MKLNSPSLWQDYYSPLLNWIQGAVEHAPKPAIVGISAPQGAGKTTLTTALVNKLSELGQNAVTISIDDFYLTRAEQIALAAKHRDNALLQQRGYPGTHDIDFGERVLKALKNSAREKTILCPVYDKSAHQGKGDRLPEGQWKHATPPLDLIFLEGWMLGFPKAPAAMLPDSQFREINDFLPTYDRWTKLLDAFVQIVPENIDAIVDWRIEAEEKMKAQGKPGMTKEEVTAYIKKFIMAYEIYLPLLAKRKISAHQLRLTIGRDRMPRSMPTLG